MMVATMLLGMLSRDDMSPMARFTYDVVDALVHSREIPKPTTKTSAHGVFVTIESAGIILGCRGSVDASQSSLEEEIIKAARSASLFDPRYKRVVIGDRKFAVTLTIVDRLEPMQSVLRLSPADGIVLTSGQGTGVVLPYEGRDPDTRLKWAYQKASTPFGSAVTLQRLIASRYRYPEK